MYFMEVRLFGTMEIAVEGRSLQGDVSHQKDVWLLALLLFYYPQMVSRKKLGDMLWPDSPDSRHTLKSSLYRLRKLIGAECRCCIQTKSGAQALCLDLTGLWVDLIEFDQLIARGTPESLSQALPLYRGDFLENCREFWAESIRKAYRAKFLSLLVALAAGEETAGNFERAAQRWSQVYQAEPFSESEHALRNCMKCLAKSGKRDESLTLYRNHWDSLYRHLRRDPQQETVALYKGLLHAETPSESDIRFTPPAPLTEIIGRQVKLECLQSLLRQMRTGGPRLITLVGTGGVGKTRLACELAYRMRDDYLNGVAFLELSRLGSESDCNDLAAEVADQLDIPEQTGKERLEALLDVFRSICALLVLDNCEHLLNSCAHFAAYMLEHCPNIRLLITSRHPLGLYAERCEQVGPLPYPVPTDISDEVGGRAKQLSVSPSVRLFVERAASLPGGFTLTDSNAGDVAAICHRLDGLPLALELAAAWTSLLSPAQIRNELEKHFRLLAGGERTALERHRTMDAAIAWSYALLTPQQKEMFARLSVFAGGWTLQSVEHICVNALERIQVPSLVKALLDHSLIQKEALPEEIVRFRYLNVIREFACKQLASMPQAGEVAARHRRWCLRYAAEADSHLRGSDLLLWLKRMEQESDNLRAVLDWACSAEGDIRFGLELVCSMAHFWTVRCHFRESYQRFDMLLKKAKLCSGSVAQKEFLEWTAKSQIRGGLFAEYSGQSVIAIRWLREGLHWAQQSGEIWETAYALNALGFAYHTTDPAYADALLDESEALAAKTGDLWLGALLHSTQGFLRMFQSRSDAARALLETGLVQAQASGDPWLTGELTYHLGLNALLEQNWTGAREFLAQCLPIFDVLGDRLGLCSALAHLGNVSLLIGENGEACRHWQRSLYMGKSIAYGRGIALSLDGYALLAESRGDHGSAVRLIRAADALRDRWQTPRVPFWVPQLNACIAHALDALGADAFQLFAREGYGLTLDQAQTLVNALTGEFGGSQYD